MIELPTLKGVFAKNPLLITSGYQDTGSRNKLNTCNLAAPATVTRLSPAARPQPFYPLAGPLKQCFSNSAQKLGQFV